MSAREVAALTTLKDLVMAGLKNPDAVGKVVDGIRCVADAIREIELQKTEQARIASKAQVQIAEIHAVRDVLLQYLDRSFDERRENFGALFASLDKALDGGNLEVAAQTLESVVNLAKSSPFKDLADVAQAKAVLKDKSREHEF